MGATEAEALVVGPAGAERDEVAEAEGDEVAEEEEVADAEVADDEAETSEAVTDAAGVVVGAVSDTLSATVATVEVDWACCDLDAAPPVGSVGSLHIPKGPAKYFPYDPHSGAPHSKHAGAPVMNGPAGSQRHAVLSAHLRDSRMRLPQEAWQSVVAPGSWARAAARAWALGRATAQARLVKIEERMKVLETIVG